MRRPEVPSRSRVEQVDNEHREAARQRSLEAEAVAREEAAELRDAAKRRRRAERAQVQRFTAGRRKRIRNWGIGIGAVVVALGILIALVTTPVMSVREIRVEGSDRVTEEQVVEALEAQLGKPIALVNDSEIGDALSQFTALESYAVDLLPPSTLLIRITERTPVALSADGNLLDAAGIDLGAPREGEGNLPTVKDVAPGSPEFEAISRVLTNLSPFMLEHVSEISASSPQSIQLRTDRGQTVIWGGADQSTLKSETVQALLQSDAVEGKTIDVSAPEHPVVR